jgi:hypothetical protein
LYFTQDYILYYPSQNKDLIEWIEKNNEVTSFPLETEEGISYGRAM